jgi:hypothetical protein
MPYLNIVTNNKLEFFIESRDYQAKKSIMSLKQYDAAQKTEKLALTS